MKGAPGQCVFGLTDDDLDQPEPVAVLPCCLPAVRLFDLVQGQWRVGFGGAYALDYTAVAAVMRDVLCIRKSTAPICSRMWRSWNRPRSKR